MKLKFDSNLTYQAEAVKAVVDVFDGQPLSQSGFEVSFTEQVGMVEQTELGLGNRLTLDDDQLLANVHEVQTRNEIEPVDELKGRQFSVEMETGTGKTYVYLRTIFELNQKYGFKKFIIVVPSVAIREGTLKNLQVTEEHFKALYENVPVNYYVYDSSKISQLRQFATSNQIQILIINIDAFRKIAVDEDDKKGNVIHRDNDRLSGRKPIEFIQATNPIVIVDEPQSVDNTPKAQEAMATLNPLCTLRYSATHRNPYNLLYKLDPIRAYDMKLVKRIEVASVMSEENLNKPYICLTDTDNKNGIKAKLKIHIETKGGAIKEKAFWYKQGDDLSAKPNAREDIADEDGQSKKKDKHSVSRPTINACRAGQHVRPNKFQCICRKLNIEKSERSIAKILYSEAYLGEFLLGEDPSIFKRLNFENYPRTSALLTYSSENRDVLP